MSRASSRSARTMRAAWALVAVLVLSACAGIPTSGPVTKVAAADDLGQSAVRYTPARPLPGASPEQIVRGFLDAMLAFPASSRTAASFLTPQAARGWSPTTQVRIYSQPEVAGAADVPAGGDPPGGPDGAVTVRLGFTDDARLDRQGRYTGVEAPGAVTYTLERVDGQWRIADPQDGLLVNQKFFTDYFRPFDLYFFDRPGRRLVPDPVYLVVGDQLATTLAASLAGGPAADAQTATRTFMPERAALRPSVPVSSRGVADVEFTDDFADLPDSSKDRLSAQLVWTLRQVPGVEGVQVVGGATALTAGGDEVQPVQAWGGFGPSTARDRAYAVVDGRVVEADDGELRPMSGAWGKDARGARRIAVSQSGVAGVLPGGDEVRLTSRQGKTARTIRGQGFVGPDWDSDGLLWLVDRPAGAVRVRVVEDDGVTTTIPAAGLASLDVTDFKLSPDGARYAVTTRSPDGRALYVGRIVRDATDRIAGLQDPVRVATTAQSPRSASWASTTELAFLGDSEVGAQIYQVAIDGSETTSQVSRSGSLLPDVGADTLAIGQDRSPLLYVTDRRKRLWFLPPGGSWRMLDTPPTTALTIGR
ncbi:MAG: LpqB family beta-propeller domain-containing protein [Aeromicrobium sp.]